VALTLSPATLDEAALEHALDLLGETRPEPVRRARAALDVILDGVRRSPWTDVAWCASALSPNGYPVQFVLDVGGDIAYVAEVVGPEAATEDKLERALEVLDELGAPALPVSWVAGFGAVRSAWVGVTHRPHGDEYMLYVEVPRGGGPRLLERLVPASLLPPLAALGRLDTVGVSGTGRIELYCACDRTDARLIESGMLRLGLGERAGDLIGLIERTPARPASLLLQGGAFGLGATLVGGEVESFMVVVPARRMLGRDHDTRRRLLELADDEGWDLSAYAELTRTLDLSSSRRVPVHGLFAWTVTAAALPGIRVACAPPGGSS
jgi:hypothetical protein